MNPSQSILCTPSICFYYWTVLFPLVYINVSSEPNKCHYLLTRVVFTRVVFTGISLYYKVKQPIQDNKKNNPMQNDVFIFISTLSLATLFDAKIWTAEFLSYLASYLASLCQYQRKLTYIKRLTIYTFYHQQSRYEDYIPDEGEGDADFLGGFFGTVSYHILIHWYC